jgi:hypothetical protein
MAISPIQAIRKKCLWCMAENAKQVSECHLKDCPFFYYRFGKKENPGDGVEIKTTLKSIRVFCLECSTFNVTKVRNCEIKECPIYLFRMGRNPNRAGICGKGFKT